MRYLIGAAAAAAAVAGCGSGSPGRTVAPPRLPHALARSWVQQAETVGSTLAAGDACRAKTLAVHLQSQVVAAVNAHRVPRPLLEPLSSGVNDLVSQIVCAPPPASAPGRSGKHGHGKHGKGEGD